MTALEDLSYILPVIQTAEDLRMAWDSYRDDPDIRWYLEERTRALVAAGKWNPLKHPRGRDGRFIDVLSWVKVFMPDMRWHRGQVESIDDDGAINVYFTDGSEYADGDGITHIYDPKLIYTLPKPKAKLDLPDPTSDSEHNGFVKVGGQGGSNPGGMYEITEAAKPLTDLDVKTDDIDSLPTVDPTKFHPSITGDVHLVQTESGVHALEITTDTGEGAPAITYDDQANGDWAYKLGTEILVATEATDVTITIKTDPNPEPAGVLGKKTTFAFSWPGGTDHGYVTAILALAIRADNKPVAWWDIHPLSGGPETPGAEAERVKVSTMLEQAVEANLADQGFEMIDPPETWGDFIQPSGPGRPIVKDMVTGQAVHTSSLAGMPVIKAKLDDAAAEALVEASTTNGKPSTDAPTGKFYIKKSKSKTHAANEVLANRLYEMAGVSVPDVFMGTDDVTVASHVSSGDIHSLSDATPEELELIRKDFVVDAWLANWDVAGLDYDNMIVVDGVPQRIDAGGSLLFRAQGSPKGEMFGTKVGELDSLVNKTLNPQSAKIFAGITDEEKMDGAKRVAAITPAEITTAVHDAGLPLDVADTLIARRADILETFGLATTAQLLDELPHLANLSDVWHYPGALEGDHNWTPMTVAVQDIKPGDLFPAYLVQGAHLGEEIKPNSVTKFLKVTDSHQALADSGWWLEWEDLNGSMTQTYSQGHSFPSALDGVPIYRPSTEATIHPVTPEGSGKAVYMEKTDIKPGDKLWLPSGIGFDFASDSKSLADIPEDQLVTVTSLDPPDEYGDIMVHHPDGSGGSTTTWIWKAQNNLVVVPGPEHATPSTPEPAPSRTWSPNPEDYTFEGNHYLEDVKPGMWVHIDTNTGDVSDEEPPNAVILSVDEPVHQIDYKPMDPGLDLELGDDGNFYGWNIFGPEIPVWSKKDTTPASGLTSPLTPKTWDQILVGDRVFVSHDGNIYPGSVLAPNATITEILPTDINNTRKAYYQIDPGVVTPDTENSGDQWSYLTETTEPYQVESSVTAPPTTPPDPAAHGTVHDMADIKVGDWVWVDPSGYPAAAKEGGKWEQVTGVHGPDDVGDYAVEIPSGNHSVGDWGTYTHEDVATDPTGAWSWGFGANQVLIADVPSAQPTPAAQPHTLADANLKGIQASEVKVGDWVAITKAGSVFGTEDSPPADTPVAKVLSIGDPDPVGDFLVTTDHDSNQHYIFGSQTYDVYREGSPAKDGPSHKTTMSALKPGDWLMVDTGKEGGSLGLLHLPDEIGDWEWKHIKLVFPTPDGSYLITYDDGSTSPHIGPNATPWIAGTVAGDVTFTTPGGGVLNYKLQELVGHNVTVFDDANQTWAEGVLMGLPDSSGLHISNDQGQQDFIASAVVKSNADLPMPMAKWTNGQKIMGGDKVHIVAGEIVNYGPPNFSVSSGAQHGDTWTITFKAIDDGKEIDLEVPAWGDPFVMYPYGVDVAPVPSSEAWVEPADVVPTPTSIPKPSDHAPAKAEVVFPDIPKGENLEGYKLADGYTAQVGGHVQHVTKGKLGTIHHLADQDKYPGMVWVQYTDSPKPVMNSTKKLKTPGTTEGALYASDGTQLAIGQQVTAGKYKQLGTIVSLSPSMDSALVELTWSTEKYPAGHKLWKKVSTIEVISGPLTEDDAVAAVAGEVTEAAPVVNYEEPDIPLIPFQDEVSKGSWFALGGKLMADGNRPYVGMPVVDKKGAHFVVMGLEKGTSLKLYPVAQGNKSYGIKWVHRVPNNLSADLDSPVFQAPTVSKFYVQGMKTNYQYRPGGKGAYHTVEPSGDPQLVNLHDGDVLYRTWWKKEEGNVTSYDYWVVTAKGKVKYIGPYGAGLLQDDDLYFGYDSDITKNFPQKILPDQTHSMEVVARGADASDNVVAFMSGGDTSGKHKWTPPPPALVKLGDIDESVGPETLMAQVTTAKVLGKKKGEKVLKEVEYDDPLAPAPSIPAIQIGIPVTVKNGTKNMKGYRVLDIIDGEPSQVKVADAKGHEFITDVFNVKPDKKAPEFHAPYAKTLKWSTPQGAGEYQLQDDAIVYRAWSDQGSCGLVVVNPDGSMFGPFQANIDFAKLYKPGDEGFKGEVILKQLLGTEANDNQHLEVLARGWTGSENTVAAFAGSAKGTKPDPVLVKSIITPYVTVDDLTNKDMVPGSLDLPANDGVLNVTYYDYELEPLTAEDIPTPKITKKNEKPHAPVPKPTPEAKTWHQLMGDTDMVEMEIPIKEVKPGDLVPVLSPHQDWAPHNFAATTPFFKVTSSHDMPDKLDTWALEWEGADPGQKEQYPDLEVTVFRPKSSTTTTTTEEPSTPEVPKPPPPPPIQPAQGQATGLDPLPVHADQPPTLLQVGGTILPPPKPPELVKNEPAAPVLDLPVLSGEANPDFEIRPSVPKAHSLMSAAHYIINHADDDTPQSGAVYADMDGKALEDQAVRFQAVVGSDGKEYLEAVIRLNQDDADAIGTKLLTKDNSAKTEYGAWVSEGVNVKDLNDGDLITVRVGHSVSVYGDEVSVLKPTDGDPNVRVVGSPTPIGQPTGPKGTAAHTVWRVSVVDSQGNLGQVDIEDRGTTTDFSRYTFDWTKPKPVKASSVSVHLHPQAADAGWTVTGKAGLLKTKPLPDPSGKKVYLEPWDAQPHTENSYTYQDFIGQGSSLLRTFGDGSMVQFNYAYPGQSGRPGNINNIATIRIPMDAAQDDIELSKVLTQGLESLGVDITHQHPPKAADVRALAINKIARLLTPGGGSEWWGKMTNATGYDGDPDTDTILNDLATTIHMPRKITMDEDVILFSESDGRTWVGFSDEVADQITKNKGVTYFVSGFDGHENTMNHYEQMLNALAGTHGGLLGGSERYTRGMESINGQSTGTDMHKGTGDRIYLSSGTGSSLSLHVGSSGFFISPRAIDRSTEIYAGGGGDGFGSKVKPWVNAGAMYEQMYKRTIPPDMIAYAKTSSAAQRDKMIKELHSRGIHTIGGRKIEDVIIYDLNGIQVKSEGFLSLGQTEIGQIKIADLPDSPGEGVVAA